jgi:hypothetical protein
MERHEGEKTMRKALFAVLAVLGLATAALAPAANAHTQVFPQNQNEGANN